MSCEDFVKSVCVGLLIGAAIFVVFVVLMLLSVGHP